MATIPEIKVHFSIQHADIPSYLAKAFSIIVRESRPPCEAKISYNPDPRSLDYRLNGAAPPQESGAVADRGVS
jgi:hypothetical protein